MEKKKEIEGRYALPGIDYADVRILGERIVAQVVPAGVDPNEDSPSPLMPPPYTIKFIEEDRLAMIDGRFVGGKVDLIREASGTVKWLRLGGAVRIKGAQLM